MKKLLLCSLLLLLSIFAKAQMKVGDNPATINSNSMLEVESTDKGLLMPRLALTATTNPSPLSAHVAGMVIYNTATAGSGDSAVSPGFYYDNGTAWSRVVNTTDFWSLNGNSGIDPATQFIGTTDNNSLAFRTNNTEYMRLDSLGNFGIKTTTPQYGLDVNDSFDLHFNGFHVLSTDDVLPAYSPGIQFMGIYNQIAPSDVILNGVIGLGPLKETVTGFVSAQRRCLWLAMDGFLIGGVGNMNTNAGAAVSIDSLNATLGANDATGNINSNIAVQQDNVQLHSNNNTLSKFSTINMYDSSYALNISNSAANQNFSLHYNDNIGSPYQFEENMGNGDSSYFSMHRNNSWFVNLNNTAASSNMSVNATNTTFGYNVNNPNNNSGFQMDDTSSRFNTYNPAASSASGTGLTNNNWFVNMSDPNGGMNINALRQSYQINIGNALSSTNFFVTDTAGYFQGFNGVSGHSSYFGFNNSTPQETVDINGSLKVADNGYGVMNDGDTSPVPTGGPGTIIFSNSHFFGWDGSTWKQLDN